MISTPLSGRLDPLLDDVRAIEKAVLARIDAIPVRSAGTVRCRCNRDGAVLRRARTGTRAALRSGSPPTRTSCGGVHGPHGSSAVRMRIAPLPITTSLHSPRVNNSSTPQFGEELSTVWNHPAAVEHHPLLQAAQPTQCSPGRRCRTVRRPGHRACVESRSAAAASFSLLLNCGIPLASVPV